MLNNLTDLSSMQIMFQCFNAQTKMKITNLTKARPSKLSLVYKTKLFKIKCNQWKTKNKVVPLECPG